MSGQCPACGSKSTPLSDKWLVPVRAAPETTLINKWPSFSTIGLGDSDEGDAEMERRRRVYDREMRALIGTGDFHQDRDGWWVHTATGELVGSDPEIERPLTDEELANAKPFAEVFPEWAEAFRKGEVKIVGDPRHPLKPKR